MFGVAPAAPAENRAARCGAFERSVSEDSVDALIPGGTERGLVDAKAGRVMTVDTAFARLRQELNLPGEK